VRFAHPWFFALLALVPVFLWWQLRKRRAAVVYSDLGFLRGAPNRGRWARPLVLAAYSLAFVFMTVALARPQRGRQYQDVETRGIDIMLCLDISGSMQAEDFSPDNRLAVAKQRAKEFIAKRQGDRIGLVVFSATSLTQCPLTLDRNILNGLIDRVSFGMLEDGTAIGMGIASAVARLKDSKAKDRVIILLTDGVNNTGDIDPITAAQAAASYGIKVYTIGVGSKGLVPYPVNDPYYGRRYVQVQIDLDSETLQRIADITGGKFFLATDNTGLGKVYDEIDRMEPTTFKVKQYTVYNELAGGWLLASLVTMLLALGLATVVLRRLP
jgi:Ca-activated chloride channel family protein